MITKDEIYKLANLARIELSDEEMGSLTKDIDSILGYVGQVTKTTGDLKREIPKLHNVLRDDIVTHTPRQYTEKLLANTPSRDKDFLKVKKIL